MCVIIKGGKFNQLTSCLRSGHVLDCLHPPSCGHHDDLLAPSSSDDLLTTLGHDLLLATTRLVDDDGLLAPHGGHLHAWLALTADSDHIGSNSSYLGCPRLVYLTN